MSFGLTIEKLFLIGLVAMFVVGPDRLPIYAQSLARLVVKLRDMARGAETRIRDEVGEDFDIAELKKLDPRQYDPRRIIRDALNEPTTPPPSQVRPSSVRPKDPVDDASTTFDSEAT